MNDYELIKSAAEAHLKGKKPKGDWWANKLKSLEARRTAPGEELSTAKVKSAAGFMDTVGGYGQQLLDFGGDAMDGIGRRATDAFNDFQAWRGWNQLRSGLGDRWEQAQTFAAENPELVGAGLGAIGGGLGLTGMQSIGSAISGVPQTTPLLQRGLTNAAIGALLGGTGGYAYRAFNQPGPRGSLRTS